MIFSIPQTRLLYNLSKYPRGLISILLLATLFFYWQLWGLRYTNHDDIFLNLAAYIYSDDYSVYAESVASRQGRLQAYIIIPMILGVHAFSESILYDILSITSILAVYASLIYLLNKIGTAKNAIALITAILFLFPLHYYFTIPQGYPLYLTWGFCFALFSAGLFASYLQEAANWKIIASSVLFICSLLGEEYNFILHPILLCIVLLTVKNSPRGSRLIKIALPYLIGWISSAGAYLTFYLYRHYAGTDILGRVIPSFDFSLWLKTFLILQEKAFLPISLFRGIGIGTATLQGVPELPSNISYDSLLQDIPDITSLVIVFTAMSVLFTMSLQRQMLTKQNIAHYSIIFISIAFIPSAVLAVSSHYQEIVPAGYLQGHIVSFYSQLGMAGLLFLLLAAICNISNNKLKRNATVLVCSLLLAWIATITIIYNNLNRQVMSANMQKWEAMQQFTNFIHSQRIDILNKVFYAPDFWTFSGVSTIPGYTRLSKENYWTEYTRAVLKNPLKIENIDKKMSSEKIWVTYFSIPSGTPLIVFYEQKSDNDLGALTLVAASPVLGTLTYESLSGNRLSQSTRDWTCTNSCTIKLVTSPKTSFESITFKPRNTGSKNLLAQFFLGRDGKFGAPYK